MCILNKHFTFFIRLTYFMYKIFIVSDAIANF